MGIYARVSKADRDDPNSIPVQLADCRGRASDQEWDVVDEYVDEGISAWSPGRRRPEFERLMSDVEAGRVDTILTREQERLLRQLKEGVRVADLAEAGKLRMIAFTLEADINFRRARDRKDFRDRVSSAIFYSDFLSEKIRRTMAAKRERGEWHGGGRRPAGYRIVGPRPYRLVPDEREATFIRDAARAVIGGASLHSIVRMWNDGPDRFRKDSGSRWTIMDVRRVLMSAQIAGIGGNWEPILTADEHDLVVARLNDPSRRKIARDEKQAQRWLLAGHVRCGKCGTRMRGRTQTRGTKSGTTIRRQYACETATGGCASVAIAATGLERLVLKAAMDRLPDVPEEPVNDQVPAGVPSEREGEVLAEMRVLEARRKELGHLLGSGMDPVVVQTAVADVHEQIEALRKELGAFDRKPRVTRRYLEDLEAPNAFVAGERDDLPPAWFDAARELLDYLGVKATIAPARSRGIRFDATRVRIAWRTP